MSIANNRGEARWYSGVHTDFGLAKFARGENYLEPFSVSDGILHIQMDKDSGQWESGLLQSVNSKTEGFKQSYGYFEMRAKLPEESGAWAAFWLISEEDRYDKSNVRVEIDTVEAYSDSPLGYSGHIHYTPNETTTSFSSKISGGMKERVGSLFDDQFHTYGTMITPQWIITYFDGLEVGRVAASQYTSAPFYMIIDLAMLRDPGDPSIVYDMEVDYVRVYAKDAPALPTPIKGGSSGVVGDSGAVAAPPAKAPIVPQVTSGPDVLNGTTGVDTMAAGDGDDIYWVNHAGDKVIEQMRAGNDTINASVDYTLPGNVENLKLFGDTARVATGNAANNVITGNALDNLLLGLGGNDELSGMDGNDRLDGGQGADVMIGGRGDDIFIVDNFGDQVIETSGQGKDTVYTSVSFSVGQQSIETVILTGRGNFNLVGGAANETLTGNAGNNILDGGAGRDIMIGGAGDDTYYFDYVNDQAVEELNGGYDTLYTPFSSTLLGTNIERLILTGNANVDGSGSEGNDALYGNAGKNLLDGRGGADVMAGREGDDVYFVDHANDRVIEARGQGSDTVNTTVSFDASGQSIEIINLRGSAAINAIGNGEANTIFGNGANNVIHGGSGNDWIEGKGGQDTLTGGTGADTFVFDTQLGFHLYDKITDFAHGVDKIALSTRIFSMLGEPGKLSADVFEVGQRPSSADAHVIYDNQSGMLYFDADGNTSSKWLPIAELQSGLNLTASDFIII